MKCKLRFERELSMETVPPPSQALIDAAVPKMRGKKMSLWLPVGTEIDHPDAHYIVKNGQADPSDEECRIECACSPEELAARYLAAEMLDKGIAPNDRALYAKGYILGYNKDGSFKPGPKWTEYAATLKAAESEEDDI